MTPNQIALVQASFGKVVPIKDTAAELFYTRLFELDPGLESMFHGDMKEQGRKLMAMIAFAVYGLDDLGTILPLVEELGQGHVGYGVEPGHYDTVAAALLWTLEQGLGEDFTEEAKQAWVAAYGLLASAMLDAGAQKAA